MKHIIFYILLLSSFNFTSVSLLAQTNETKFWDYVIVARKKEIVKTYKPGTKLFLSYFDRSGVQKIKGYLSRAIDNNITILPRKKSNEEVTIAVDSIVVLRKIKPSQRISFSVIGSILIGTGAILMDKAGDSPSGAMGSALLIPVIGAGVYFLFSIPFSLMIEKVSERKKKDGWEFSIRRL